MKALVTGATSGIGKCIAKGAQLERLGAHSHGTQSEGT